MEGSSVTKTSDKQGKGVNWKRGQVKGEVCMGGYMAEVRKEVRLKEVE